jgi:hypothetical protein
MAFFPCVAGPHANPGKNYLVYVGVGLGNQFDRWRLRFCRVHLPLVQEQLAEFKLNPESGTVGGNDVPSPNCFACGEPLGETGRQVFLTCYPPNNEREDYWARIHVTCSVPPLLQDSWTQPHAS